MHGDVKHTRKTKCVCVCVCGGGGGEREMDRQKGEKKEEGIVSIQTSIICVHNIVNHAYF